LCKRKIERILFVYKTPGLDIGFWVLGDVDAWGMDVEVKSNFEGVGAFLPRMQGAEMRGTFLYRE
jgi:hypothetical protein